jgi:tetratricopeptide (TPR) repeat protein
MKEAEQFLNYDRKATAEISKNFVHTYSAAIDMANMRLNEKKFDEALAMADDAMKQYPGVWDVVKFKAIVLLRMDRVPESIALVKSFTDTHWWHYESFITLGGLYVISRDGAGAIAQFQHAASLDIHAEEPFFRIADVDDKLLNRPDDAMEARITGLMRNPDLSKMLDNMDRKKQDFMKAVQKADEIRQTGTIPGYVD